MPILTVNHILLNNIIQFDYFFLWLKSTVNNSNLQENVFISKAGIAASFIDNSESNTSKNDRG